MSCSFSDQVLAKLDLLRNLMFSKAYKNIAYLSLKKLDVTVAKLHILALNAELTVLARIKQIIQVSSPELLFTAINVNDYGMASTRRHQAQPHTGMWTRVALPWFWRSECHAPACSFRHWTIRCSMIVSAHCPCYAVRE